MTEVPAELDTDLQHGIRHECARTESRNFLRKYQTCMVFYAFELRWAGSGRGTRRRAQCKEDESRCVLHH